MDADILSLFAKTPGALPIYEALEGRILETFPGVRIKISRTQVSFSNKYGFAYAWPPVRRRKGWPETCLLLTFGLGYHLEDPRIVEAVEPYPGRWTHHVILQSVAEIDEQVMAWIAESYHFSMTKRRAR